MQNQYPLGVTLIEILIELYNCSVYVQTLGEIEKAFPEDTLTEKNIGIIICWKTFMLTLAYKWRGGNSCDVVKIFIFLEFMLKLWRKFESSLSVSYDVAPSRERRTELVLMKMGGGGEEERTEKKIIIKRAKPESALPGLSHHAFYELGCKVRSFLEFWGRAEHV